MEHIVCQENNNRHKIKYDEYLQINELLYNFELISKREFKMDNIIDENSNQFYYSKYNTKNVNRLTSEERTHRKEVIMKWKSFNYWIENSKEFSKIKYYQINARKNINDILTDLYIKYDECHSKAEFVNSKIDRLTFRLEVSEEDNFKKKDELVEHIANHLEKTVDFYLSSNFPTLTMEYFYYENIKQNKLFY